MSQIVISVQVVRNILAVINLRFNIQKLTDEIDFVWMDVVMKKKVSLVIRLMLKQLEQKSSSPHWISKDADLMSFVVKYLICIYHQEKEEFQEVFQNTIEKYSRDAQNSIITEAEYLRKAKAIQDANSWFDTFEDMDDKLSLGVWVKAEYEGKELICLKISI